MACSKTETHNNIMQKWLDFQTYKKKLALDQCYAFLNKIGLIETTVKIKTDRHSSCYFSAYSKNFSNYCHIVIGGVELFQFSSMDELQERLNRERIKSGDNIILCKNSLEDLVCFIC